MKYNIEYFGVSDVTKVVSGGANKVSDSVNINEIIKDILDEVKSIKTLSLKAINR